MRYPTISLTKGNWLIGSGFQPADLFGSGAGYFRQQSAGRDHAGAETGGPQGSFRKVGGHQFAACQTGAGKSQNHPVGTDCPVCGDRPAVCSAWGNAEFLSWLGLRRPGIGRCGDTSTWLRVRFCAVHLLLVIQHLWLFHYNKLVCYNIIMSVRGKGKNEIKFT